MISDATRVRPLRGLLGPLLLVLLLAFVVACSGDGESALDTQPTASAEPSPPDSDDAEAAVLAAWEAYWTVHVASENNADDSPEPFKDVATGSIVERQLKSVGDYKEMGLVRVGAPEFRDAQVTVDGDTAEVEFCMNEDTWGAEVDGEPVAPPDLGFRPRLNRLELHDDAWLVVESAPGEEITC
ncbi:hypothetical protein [Nocardioides massiliensis]|uniref:Nuclear transport factor 2 family protein n=1 Tax=Nocardioides massiliensis TaxID=1325935 RepID=A0ABT9NK43_9ACTN|nr:hypothetical protein [Nocardioides massiliensis]MDP9820592.1 hypothetical protein [Nocardioides massiliensis]